MDDAEDLRQAVRVNGLTWNSVKWAFTAHEPYYYPLARLSHALDYQIWGKNAVGHHTTSVVVHALNAALVFGFLWALLGAVSLGPGERLTVALWVAAVFAIHPMQTESVAWLAGRGQLLCTTFGIGCVWAYVLGTPRWAVKGLFVAALLSRPIAVSLPFVMLAIDYFPLRHVERFGWSRLILDKAVLIALAGVVGLATMVMLSREGAMVSLKTLGLMQRVFLMFQSLTFYVRKVVWPSHLLPVYQLTLGLSLDQWPVLASVLSVVMITVVVVMERRRVPMLAAAWGAYVILVLPMSGLLNKGMGAVALRYAYLAILPLLLVVGGAGVWAWRRSTTAAHFALIGLLAGQLCVFGVRTRSRIPDWHDDETLQRAILAEYPDSAFDNRALAQTLLDQGRTGEALVYAQRDVEIAPQMWEAHMMLGDVLIRLGRRQEAMAQHEQAFRMNNDAALAHYNFGVVLMELGKVPEAAEHFEQTLRIKPDDAEADINLGAALEKLGRDADAIRHYKEALRIKPDGAEVYYSLGNVFWREGKVSDAIGQYEQALRIKPDYVEAHYNCGVALEQVGRVQDAITHYEQVLRVNPDYAEAHNNLGIDLAQTGKIDEAIAHCEQALRIKPDYAEAHYNLGIALEQSGRVQEAIGHYQQAVKLRPDFAPASNALARLQVGR
jgi:tetratricopeptide (TPR) repeat protein